MSKKQILALFVCSLVLWTVGNGLLPLLPIYAIQLGASPDLAGYYLSFSYITLAVGAISAGWLSDKFNRRKTPLIIIGLACILLTWLMGWAGNIWCLSFLTAVLWGCGGLGLALIGILTGLSAKEKERGTVYGILSLANGLGAFIGGMTTGFIADRWGYAVMFSAMAVFCVLLPLAGIFLTEKEGERGGGFDRLGKKVSLGSSYRFLFLSSLFASIPGFIIFLGRSLLMRDLEYGAFAISSTGAISGLVAMPIPLLMGWLSDRTGRKIYMYLGYLAVIAGLLVLTISTSLWNFYIVLTLQALFVGVNTTVGNALVMDLVPQASLGRGLSLFNATAWIGGIIGFSGGGYAYQSYGLLTTVILGICFVMFAMVLLLPVRVAVRK